VLSGVYGFVVATLKVPGAVTIVGAVAPGFVAFGMWRRAFRDRILGIDRGQF
jgi:hypothetical protein